MSKNNKIAFCGVVSALCIALMFLGSILPFFQYTIPAITGVLILFVMIETSVSWAIMSFTTVSVLSMLICPDKEPVLLFVLILGYYPILKFYIEKIKIKFFWMPLKLLLFNAAAILYFTIATKVLKVPIEEFQAFGFSVAWIILIIGNVTFFLYDFALRGVAIKYLCVIHPKVKKIIK